MAMVCAWIGIFAREGLGTSAGFGWLTLGNRDPWSRFCRLLVRSLSTPVDRAASGIAALLASCPPATPSPLCNSVYLEKKMGTMLSTGHDFPGVTDKMLEPSSPQKLWAPGCAAGLWTAVDGGPRAPKSTPHSCAPYWTCLGPNPGLPGLPGLPGQGSFAQEHLNPCEDAITFPPDRYMIAS